MLFRSQQENISNGAAKKLIDNGLVFVGNKKVLIARADMHPNTAFKVEHIGHIKVLFEDDKIIAVNKPPSVVSENLEKLFDAKLLHRLDKDTSGVLILVKDEEFRLKAIEEFRKYRVYKEYEAIVSGHLYEETKIDLPISTEKGHKAKSKIEKHGQTAVTEIEPIAVAGKKTHIKVVIHTGRTHQIRVHLAHLLHPIIGDTLYGGKHGKRMMLHAKRIRIFDYNIVAPVPTDFKHLMGAD